MSSHTSLARVQTSSVPAVELREPHVVRRDLSPEVDFRQLMELAKTLVSTGFLPEAIKTPAQAAAIILTGRELGIPPMHALRSINVIKGKPVLASELQLALFHRAGGKSRILQSSDVLCEMWFRHPNGTEHTEKFTLEDAKRADLLGKDSWRKYAKAMYRARCISSGLRVLAPDIVAGVYDPEELGGEIDDDGAPVIPVDAKRVTKDDSLASKDPYVEQSPRTGEWADRVPTGLAPTEEQISRVLDLVAEPQVPAAVREKIERKLKAGVSGKVVDAWIDTLELNRSAAKGDDVVDPDTGEVLEELPLDDRRPSAIER